MEDNATIGRSTRPSPRPESPASATSRRTPSSSNGSSAKFNMGPRMTSGAALLQERLRERKVESARSARRASLDMNGESAVSSSPITATGDKRPSVSNKTMGVKQIEEHVSTLTKQNFNLKLELHHRRERQTALESRLEAAEKQIEEQSEVQEINEQLLQELEKRDQAVEEAVGIIVTLEEKIETLMREREVVKNFDAQQHYDSGYFRVTHEDPPSSPTQEKSTGKSMGRMPSFLSEQSEGAEALRSLYLPHGQSYSEANLPQLQEETSSDGGMNSSRLSVLSESSFVSVYGKKEPPPGEEDDDEVQFQNRHRASSSVEKWVNSRPMSTSPGTSTTLRNDTHNYLSMNKIITSPLQRLERLQGTLEKSLAHPQIARSTSIQETRKKRDSLRRVITDKGSFDQQHRLPPTPDTISTSTLRHYQDSSDTLGRDAGAQSFLNSTSTFRTQASFNAYQAAIPIRPRSAGETITSKREGHGWDTETQDEFASDASVFSAEPINYTNRVPTPDLFSFSDFGNVSDNRNTRWDRDMMFSNAQPRLPALNTASNYNDSVVMNMPEHEDSEDTIRGGPSELVVPQGTYHLHTAQHPDPPKRRSSLTHGPKIRKSNPPSSVASSSQPPTGATPSPAKKQGLASRFFGRSDTSPSMSTNTIQHSSIRSPTIPGKAQYFGDDDSARATPPPILRNRGGAVPRQRPSSAGADNLRDSRAYLKRVSGFGGDESADAAKVEEQNKSNSGRNWLGLKSNSLRRT